MDSIILMSSGFNNIDVKRPWSSRQMDSKLMSSGLGSDIKSILRVEMEVGAGYNLAPQRDFTV